MASKTIFEKSDIQNMVSVYDIGDIIDFCPIESGSVQTNYIIRTSKGKFVLRYYENRNISEVKFEFLLIKKLMENSFPCAPYILSKSGEIPIYKTKPYMMFNFIEGVHIENLNECQRDNLIELIAELGIITQNLNPNYYDSRISYNKETLKNLANKRADKLNIPQLYEKLRWLNIEADALDLPESLTMGICHCDYCYTNILYVGDEIKALLDFDDANYTYSFFDIVSFINFFSRRFTHQTWNTYDINEDILDFREAREIIKIFEKKRHIPYTDKKHFFDILKLGILFDCVWYFERGLTDDFFEKRKIDALNKIGREKFFEKLFG